MVIKDLALRVEEAAARDNKSRPGIYIIAMDSERLLYGYSPRFNARAAVNSLRKKGYKGKDLDGYVSLAIKQRGERVMMEVADAASQDEPSLKAKPTE